jgi:hypothetical protein
MIGLKRLEIGLEAFGADRRRFYLGDCLGGYEGDY